MVVAAMLAATPALSCERSRFAVAIDIGHTPEAPGATSARGVPEYRFNVALAEAIDDALRQAGFTGTVLLNPDGQSLPLRERPRAAARFAPRLLLSVHHDSVQPVYLGAWQHEGQSRLFSDRFHGYSLFISRRNGDAAASERAARRLGESLRRAGFVPTLHHAEDIPGERKPLLDAELGVYAYDGLFILAHDVTPAVLIEAGVIVHRAEEAAAATPAFRRRFAGAVAEGVTAFCAEAAAAAARGAERR